MFLLLPALLVLAAGCQSTVEYAPYQTAPVPQPSYVQRASRTPARGPSSAGKPEVVEGSTAYLGSPRTITHEVGPLESVWRIGRMYGVSTEVIRSANGLGPKCELQIGQKLIIPNARMLRHVINLYRNNVWQYIILHHTATWKGNARAINVSHGDRGFWNGLGYHFLIDNGTMGKGDGQIEMSPRWIRQQVGAHCKAGGMNDKSIGIALVGNFNTEAPTANQLQALNYLLKTLCTYYKIPATNILGHREVEGAKTECPGSRFPLTSIRRSASNYRGTPKGNR